MTALVQGGVDYRKQRGAEAPLYRVVSNAARTRCAG